MASNFGTVTDYFGLESSTLIAESSESGETRNYVTSYNATGNPPASFTSDVMISPKVTYRVVGDMTLTAILGKGYVKVTGKSGYMITSVNVHTAIGEPPTVTVSSVASDGVSAPNASTVSVAISARHRAQVIDGSVTATGYNLHQLDFTAVCDPVVEMNVITENDVPYCTPVASDINHVRYEVSASAADYGTGTEYAAGTGYVLIGEPKSLSSVGYKSVELTLRKDIF